MGAITRTIVVIAGAAVLTACGPEPGGMQGQAMRGIDSEFEYLTRMIPHHEEAIDSAEALLEGTERPEMEAFAEDIIDTQSAEVDQMQEWLAIWYPARDTSVDYEPMMRDLTALDGDELDQAFLEDMIGHHMAAVMMSQQLLTRDLAEHEDVVPFAERIRDGQRAEIQQMRAWLADWFDESAMGPMTWDGMTGFGWPWVLWLLLGVALLALAVLGVVWLARALTSASGRHQRTADDAAASDAASSARKALDLRYARGQIGRDEYLQARRDLEGPAS